MRRSRFLVLLVLPVVACHRRADVEPEAGPKSVACASVASAMVTSSIEVRGTVAPLADRDAQVAPQVVGRILRFEVREGDAVTAGQVVARIDDAPLVDAARQVEAALARAQAEHQNAQTTLARVQRVFERGIAARQEVDDAAAKEAVAKAALTEADTAVHQANRQVGLATVRSPFRGVVLKVLRKPGELVDGTPATPVVEIADTSTLELVADVPAQDLVRLRSGAAATLTLSALPDRQFKASVSRVAPSVDRATGVGTVRIAIAASERPLPPIGTFGVARVESGEAHQATLVPEAALRNVVAGEAEVVVCGPDHVAHVRRVTPGTVRDGSVEVSGELEPSELVVVDPVLGIADGDAIETAK